MRDSEARPANPELKELVVEASHALARLDAARLEELALSCQALTRTLQPERNTSAQAPGRAGAGD